jgi:NADH-quinone oxidoreductase subunit J
MVLFVFVIMLLNAGAEREPVKGLGVTVAAVPLLALLLGTFGYVIRQAFPDSPPVQVGQFIGGGPREVGMAVFTRYVLPFEITSALVLIAIVGAVVLAKKEQ